MLKLQERSEKESICSKNAASQYHRPRHGTRGKPRRRWRGKWTPRPEKLYGVIYPAGMASQVHANSLA